MDPRATTESLALGIRDKHNVLRQVLELSLRQAALIADGEMTTLLSVLAAKQSLLDRLQEIERALIPFRDQDPESRDWPSAAARERCRQEARQNEQLLEEILQIERTCELQLALRRDQAAEQLQGTNDARQAQQAYLDGARPPAGQIDLTSET